PANSARRSTIARRWLRWAGAVNSPVGSSQLGKVMRRPLLQTCAALLSASPFRSWAGKTASSHAIKWVVFYGPSADASILSAYDIVILDSMFQGPIPAIAKAGARVCGYLSLGEIKTSDTYFPRLDPAALLESNPAWPGTRRVDIR